MFNGTQEQAERLLSRLQTHYPVNVVQDWKLVEGECGWTVYLPVGHQEINGNDGPEYRKVGLHLGPTDHGGISHCFWTDPDLDEVCGDLGLDFPMTDLKPFSQFICAVVMVADVFQFNRKVMLSFPKGHQADRDALINWFGPLEKQDLDHDDYWPVPEVDFGQINTTLEEFGGHQITYRYPYTDRVTVKWFLQMLWGFIASGVEFKNSINFRIGISRYALNPFYSNYPDGICTHKEAALHDGLCMHCGIDTEGGQ